MKILFVSRNEHKIREAVALCQRRGIEIEAYTTKLEELQTDDSERLVKDKLLRAFTQVKRPLIVEHTGLKIDDFAGLPAGLTQLFWDKLRAPGFCSYFPNHAVTAFTLIGYCDGRQTHQFFGTIRGRIVAALRGNSNFQWDTVFEPDGHAKTFAEMTPDQKNAISMRAIAFEKFIDHVAPRH